MPFFKYKAIDVSGAPITGSLDAVDAVTASTRLAKMGLRQISFEGGDGPTVAPRPARPAPSRPVAPAARPGVAVAPRPSSPPPVSRPERTPAPLPDLAPDSECPFAGPKERAFFFDQLGRFLNSGVAPARALETLGDQSGGRVRAHLHTASRRAAAGTGMGESLRGGFITEPERDALTASERGGYVPECCGRLAEIAMDAHRLGRGFAYPLFMIALAIGTTPLTRAMQDGALKSIELQDQAGGMLPVGGTVAREVGSRLPAMALLSGAILLGLFLLWRVWLLPPFRELRHSLVAKVPPLAGRAKGETVAMLAYHLAGLMRAGIPAYEAAALSAAAAPNLTLRRELMEGMGSLAVGTPLSKGLERTSLVEPALRHMVENGETTGDLPGALATIARVEHAETGRRSLLAGKAIFVVLNLVAIALTFLFIAIGYKHWYVNLIQLLTRGD